MPDIFTASEQQPEEHPTPIQVQKPSPKPTQQIQPQSVSSGGWRMFSAFQTNPQGMHFQDQENDETILLFLRRHFLSNTNWITTTVFLSLLPPLASILLLLTNLSFFTIPGRYLLILLLFYYLILFGYAYVNFLMWFYNVGIITNHRVIDVDLISLTTKNVAATILGDIKDVTYHQTGLMSSFFDYGDVMMETEGMKSNFEFNAIPHPAKVADTISTLVAHQPNHD